MIARTDVSHRLHQGKANTAGHTQQKGFCRTSYPSHIERHPQRLYRLLHYRPNDRHNNENEVEDCERPTIWTVGIFDALQGACRVGCAYDWAVAVILRDL